jgi:hypothetical protein
MSGADYILGLLAIVTGLAISDMVVSLHGLLINRRHVTWDWLAPLAAAYVLLLIINTWRITYVLFQDAVKGPHIWVFLMILIQTISLYLAARAALPDRVEIGEPFDLRSYYDFVGRYLWAALSVLYGGVVLLDLLAWVTVRDVHPYVLIPALVALPIVLALAIWPNRKLHQIVVPLLFLWMCIRVLPARLLIA